MTQPPTPDATDLWWRDTVGDLVLDAIAKTALWHVYTKLWGIRGNGCPNRCVVVGQPDHSEYLHDFGAAYCYQQQSLLGYNPLPNDALAALLTSARHAADVDVARLGRRLFPTVLLVDLFDPDTPIAYLGLRDNGFLFGVPALGPDDLSTHTTACACQADVERGPPGR